MREIIQGLSDNEILFCEKWEQVLKNKRNIQSSDIDYCYNLIYGKGLDSYCPQCLRDSASYLNNHFNQIRNQWNTFKNTAAEPEKPVVQDNTEQPEKQVVKKKVVKKPPTKLVKGKAKPKPKKDEGDDLINLI